MNIKKKKLGDTLTVIISGRVDTVTSPEVDAYVNQNLEGAESLILDFKDVNYVSSAGLRVLLSLHKKMAAKGGMKLINVNESVNDVFEVTGFDEILDYEMGE